MGFDVFSFGCNETVLVITELVFQAYRFCTTCDAYGSLLSCEISLNFILQILPTL